MAPVGQPFSLPPLPDSSPKPQLHDAELLSAQVPPRLTHSGCIPISSHPPFLFLDQAPTFCSILRDILGVGKMRWRGGRKEYQKSQQQKQNQTRKTTTTTTKNQNWEKKKKKSQENQMGKQEKAKRKRKKNFKWKKR